MINNQTTFTLNTGAKIPAVGFGTWQAPPHEVEIAVEKALRVGYRHLDCAAIYRNEPEVGIAIEKSGVKREEIFLTSKLWNTKHAPEDVESALDKTLEDLGTTYLDLYLMHWPVAFEPSHKWFPIHPETGVFKLGATEAHVTWKAMEALVKTGKVRAIGISNFNIRRLEELLPHCTIIPAVNQIEAHPYLQQPQLFDYCRSKGIVVEAYSPLGNNQTGEPKTMDDPKVHEIAKSLNMTPAQLLYSWGVQRGTVVLPKSVTPSRIESNFDLKELPESAMKELDALEKHKRFNFPGHWGFDIFDEAGEETVKETARAAGESNKTKFTV